MKLHPEHQLKDYFIRKTADVVHNIETNEDNVSFDPERDISEEVWQKILEEITESRENGQWTSFAQLAAEVALLSPRHAEELYLNEDLWQEMKQINNDRAYPPEYTDYNTINAVHLIFSANMLRCFPQKRREFDLEDKKWEETINDVDSRTTDIQLALMILYPDRRYLPYSEEEYMQKLDMLINRSSLSAPDAAAMVTLFFPQRKKEIANKAKVLWEVMKEKFNKQQKSNGMVTSTFLQLCRDMAILAADRAEITSDGRIVITPKQKPLKSNEPLPQRPV